MENEQKVEQSDWQYTSGPVGEEKQKQKQDKNRKLEQNGTDKTIFTLQQVVMINIF